jgi:hypothetical protein
MRLHDQLQENGGRLRCVQGDKSCAYIVARKDGKAILGYVDETALLYKKMARANRVKIL